MKKTTLTLIACSIGVAVQAQLIDDFGVAGLGEYTRTAVLDNGTSEANVSFSDASGSLSASYGGTVNQPEQVVFLRSDYTLGIGYRLLVDVLFPTQTSQMDFGIAVSATGTPAGASGSTTDTRNTFNWAAVYVRPSQDAVRATSSINGTVTTATGVLGAGETTVGKLFIERNSDTTFTLGYFDTGGTRVDSRTAVFTSTDVGTAIGFYADLRTTGGSLSALDNLRIESIPEPSAFSLFALGGFGALFVIRRKRIS